MTSWRGLPLVVWCALACGALRYMGAVWDVAWHRTLGRDSVWSPPHVLLYVAVLGATLASAWLLRTATRERVRSAALLALCGNALVLLAAPFDAYWHIAHGPDTDIWSPPHLLAVLGSGLSGLGWLSAVCAWPDAPSGLKRIRYVFLAWTAYAAWFSLNWFQMDAASRDTLVYPSLVGLTVVPALLLGRHASGLRFGATAGAAGLMLMSVVPALGFPPLGWVGPALPPLVILPALAMDLLMQRNGPMLLSRAADKKPKLPSMLAEPGLDSLLGPAERLRFERMRLSVRVGLLIGPTLHITIYGQSALGPASLAAIASLGSTVAVVFLLLKKPQLLLRYQLVCRLVDIGLVWLSVSSIQEFTGRALFDQVYLLPVISATGTHGKRGAYLISCAASLAVVAARVRLVLAGAAPLEPIMIGDAVMPVALFFITGSILDMLMRTSAGVVEQVRRSEQQEAQVALRESEARYRNISELTSDFAFGFRVEPDNSMRCEWVTEAMERMTGYSLADLEEQGGWIKLLDPTDLLPVRRWWETLMRGESGSAEFRIITRSGETRLLRGHARPLLDPLSGRLERIYGAAQDITERKQWEAALEHQALHDSLTDLPNRALLQDRLAAAIAAARRDGTCLALMMMDLDRFKDVNDTFGHHLGDVLLQQVGQRVRGRSEEH